MARRFEDALAEAKAASTLQLLFKAARLLDESAVARLAAASGAPKLRRSHTMLLPHLDLEGTRLTVLAERLGISKQAVSQLVDDLEGMGVVRREADGDDARAKRVVFTDKGRAAMLAGLTVLRELENELRARVGARGMDELRAGVLAILDAIAASAPSPAAPEVQRRLKAKRKRRVDRLR